MSASQADMLESIPFVRDITPLDLLDLPTGLVFGSLPKPHNLKRSAGGPIWPPVLTNVLVNGLLILHHKPHLVGKQGLEEHYNWLSAFIYRQTRGWDHSALARNVVEIHRTRPGERAVGVVRNRKQISSKVQTIGEYLKDTHWAYVTQGPRSFKETPSIVPAPGFPPPPTDMSAKPATNSATDQTATAGGIPDVTHVPLQLGWSPPTPFSLPITPSHSPYPYPADIPDYEFVNARILGYDRNEWQEYEEYMMHYRRAPLHSMLDNYMVGKAPSKADFQGSLLLKSISMAVQFGPKPSHIQGVSPLLLLGKHQMAQFSSINEPMQAVHFRSLDADVQRLIQTMKASDRIYHVDFPIHLPTGADDRDYLLHDIGMEYHVESSIGFHANGGIPPHDEELKAVSDVYIFSGQETGRRRPDLLEEHRDITTIKTQQPGTLFAHGLATSFAGKLWEDSINGNNTDLSCYAIVQNVFPRSQGNGHKPLLTIVCTPRLVTSPQEAKARFVLLDEINVAEPGRSEAGYESADVDGTPESTHRQLLKRPDVTLRRSGRSNSTSNAGTQARESNKASMHRPSFPVDTAGPVRNTRSQSRTRTSMLMRRPTTAPSPLAGGVQLPLTPRASPLISMQPSRRNSIAQTLLPQTPAYNTFPEDQPHADYAGHGSMISPSMTNQMFDAGHVDDWSSIMGVPGGFSSGVDANPRYVSSGSIWQPSDYQRPQPGDFAQPSYPGGDHAADRFHYYSGAPWS